MIAKDKFRTPVSKLNKLDFQYLVIVIKNKDIKKGDSKMKSPV
jgi:hypothetical protein